MMMDAKVFVFVLVAVTGLSGCNENSASQQPKARPLMSMVIEPKAAASLQLAGVVEPRIETDLGFRVLGRVVARNVGVGDLVHKGQIVAAIDPLSLELAVQSAKAELSNSQAQLINALTTEQRQQALANAKSGSEAALEAAQQAHKTTRAAVAKGHASLDKAEEQLSYAQLKAEFDGVVVSTAAELGQVVSAGQTILTIARPDVRDVVIDIPESSLAGVKIGSQFEVTLQLDHTIRADGTVREIAPEADATTRTRRVKIALTAPPATFRLGSVVTVNATTDASATITVPQSAILERDGKPNVWVVDADKSTVSLRAVEITQQVTDNDRVAIRSGLALGERIAVAGVNHLADGEAVRIDQEMAP